MLSRFVSMFKQAPNPLLRLLTPRVFFYVFLTLILAWLMHRHNLHLQEAGKAAPEQTLPSQTLEQRLLPLKESELSATPVRKKPMLILVGGPTDDLSALREKLELSFRESCSIILLNTSRDASALKFFHITKTPSVLFFGTNNQELSRKEEEITLESISHWLQKQKLTPGS